jgi:hypothetical protein
MSDKPDWDSATDDATHWTPETDKWLPAWWKEGADGWYSKNTIHDTPNWFHEKTDTPYDVEGYQVRPAKSPSERERLQNKQSWEVAPEWAEWLAQDHDGEWFWFIGRPVVYKFTFQSEIAPRGCSFASKGEVLGDWRDTLESRPESITPLTHENMRCIVKPIERKEWNGPEDGLPPVGGECEMKLADNLNYHKGHVSYYGDEILVWVCNGMEWSYSKSSCNFRPITTEEDRAVDEMLLLDPYDMNSGVGMMSRQDFCRTLYRAGYRKQEEPK